MFNLISSKEKQDTYACGLIGVNNTIRWRPKTGNGPKISYSCKYKIRIDIKEVTVCKKAFCSLIIGKAWVERLIENIKSNKLSPVELGGKYLNRPNELP